MERRDWSCIVFKSAPPGPGVLFEEVTLDEHRARYPALLKALFQLQLAREA
jgi:hypothetical protein